jgi:hypothetical protein
VYARLSQIAIGGALTTLASTCGHGNPAPPARASGPTVGGCAVFPSDNAWNTDVSKLPVSSKSAAYIAEINGSGASSLHPDFANNSTYGIPYLVVKQGTTRELIRYTAYGAESDPGPFPIPPTAPVEGGASAGGDRHVLVVEKGTCHLSELGRAFWRGDHWDATVGVEWNLHSNALRPLHYTSADAAGLPILPGLVRYDEVFEVVDTGPVRH